MTNAKYSPLGRKVKCSQCPKEYLCTPYEDYYNATCDTDGLCEKCFLENAGVLEMVTVTKIDGEIRDVVINDPVNS